MDKKQFVTGVVLRFALLIIITAAVLILRFAGGISADWWGWYVMYVLIFASAAVAAFYIVRHGRTFVVDGVRKKMMKKSAADFLEAWEAESFTPSNVEGYAYHSERDFDTSLTFGGQITVRKVLRDENGDVTGDADVREYSYGDIVLLEVTDIGGEGCAHVKISFSDGAEEYCYLDADVGRYLAQKTGLEIKGIEEYKDYCRKLADE